MPVNILKVSESIYYGRDCFYFDRKGEEGHPLPEQHVQTGFCLKATEVSWICTTAHRNHVLRELKAGNINFVVCVGEGLRETETETETEKHRELLRPLKELDIQLYNFHYLLN